VNISPGDTTTSTITVTPGTTFTGSVVLTGAITSSPAGAQDLPTLSFGSTSPVSITDAAGATALLTITTTAATSAALAHPSRPAARWYIAGATGLAFAMLIGVPVQRRTAHTRLVIIVVLMIFIGGWIACCRGGSSGGGGNPRTTPGAYVVTVTGTSGSITATGAVALTVQ
jgi:trimeric autotransporter adhesin